MFTRLQKWGNSQGIRIPKHLLTQARFPDNDEVELIAEENQIIIRPAVLSIKKYDITELFSKYTGEYKPKESINDSYGKEEL